MVSGVTSCFLSSSKRQRVWLPGLRYLEESGCTSITPVQNSIAKILSSQFNYFEYIRRNEKKISKPSSKISIFTGFLLPCIHKKDVNLKEK